MCFFPFKRLCHWGPLTAIGIIKYVTGMTIHCSSMLWASESMCSILNTACFMSLSGLTLYNFLSAIFHGPGYLPLKWMPKQEKDTVHLQFCSTCNGYKAPRSHHCRKCGRCVLKMDHHCPWINNCVGWSNHAHFTYFILFAVLGCFHASIILTYSLYRTIHRVNYINYAIGKEQFQYLGLYGLVLCVFALGLSIGVVLAVGMLLFFQVRAISRNRTGIEDWILEKANHRRTVTTKETFIFPYNLGLWNNVKQVININGSPIGDGINWAVTEGCDQYTLTREQIAQKNEKRQRSRLYKIVETASGYWFPITKGLKVCLHPPCTDESRLKLKKDETILVTRWRKYWLFGEKVNEQEIKIKGWFPRRCAVDLMENDVVQRKHKKNS